ncbi:LADA_0F03488g1_1 [Lachancea dasiensis]|uniref:LADA_0F03488g1_1 n=1 Tax=Lachancea dasiensis TaxID=1072105 RepID=A0A1G4JJ26_9SACH|nr:LADA_0F03488g1_1 [Lachancea dasiensis]
MSQYKFGPSPANVTQHVAHNSESPNHPSTAGVGSPDTSGRGVVASATAPASLPAPRSGSPSVPPVRTSNPVAQQPLPPRSSAQAQVLVPQPFEQFAESTLFLLQETLSNILIQMRNRETTHDCYTAATARHHNRPDFLAHIENIFKTLRNYPAEILSAMYIPVILRFFKWCFSLQQPTPDPRRSRFIVTTKKGIAFLMANWNEYGYNTATLYQAFKALKLLQELEATLLPQKPAAYTEQPDEEADSPNWRPLDDSQLERLIDSIGKSSNSSNVPVYQAPDYSHMQNTNLSDFMPLDYTGQLTNINNPALSTNQPIHPLYGVHQSPLPTSFSEIHEPFPGQSGPSNHGLHEEQPAGKLDRLLSQTIPEIFHRLNSLGAANDELRRQNNLLSEGLQNLKYQFTYWKNNPEDVFPKTPSPISSNQLSSQLKSDLPGSLLPGHPDPIDLSHVVANEGKLATDAAGRLSMPYDSMLPYSSSTAASGFISEMPKPAHLAEQTPSSVYASQLPPVGSMQTAVQANPGRLSSSVSVRIPSKKPRNKVREFAGATLTKGETYLPPVTPNGKNYLVDEEGKLAIVMANDQNSVYGMYNEYYQSLRPQIDSYVADFGKRSLMHFKKKRTFQKKKAFVQWVERISHFKDLSPEDVLDLIDEVRLKENRSVVWSCNNLSNMKEAFVRYKPDFRDVALYDTD